MVQSTYNNQAIGFPGGLADSSLSNIISKIADVAIPYGFGVVRGAAENGVKLPTATGGEFMGVAVSTTAGQANGSDVFQYEIDSSVNVGDMGVYYVITEQAVVPGNPVFLRHTVNAALVPGGFRKDLDTDKADAITGATFESTTAAGELAIIKIR